MDGNGNDKGIQLRMTSSKAREFAERLRDDTDFQQTLRDRPREALAEYGIEVPEEILPANIELPEPSEMQRVLEAIPGGRGFRGDPDLFFVHPIMVLIFALAFLEENPDFT